ncbi:MexH family multidrug efflux RND transporter periplasmic adaptor subunit [Vibrio zhanjiangensis]|uniref:MexH family multidrug efflux RND transporter periplasmic adaptor subunit n=2 Tax=Vibrio zhanjiangensis TaxID=1046128 RepID=A0ABQ6EUY2_9VIBR|nr:MexH family multidrug efflux RND transporter periplasmic adaptor subunit [Vibrio zhanjiangensis]
MQNGIMKKIIILTLFSLFSVTHSSLSFARGEQTKAITVITEDVESHQVSQSLTLVGKIEAKQSVVIASEVTGRVDNIAIKANQQVEAGQLLIQLEDDKAKASIAEANAYLDDELRKLKEFERLAKSNAITQTEIDAQKASVAIARARLDAAKANLSDLHIKAPFSGTVGFIDFSLGKLVTSGDDLVTLDDLSVMQLDLQVPERYLSQISKGMVVLATTAAWGKQEFRGQVVGVDSRINRETLNLRVRIHFPNSSAELKPGMLVSATMAFPAIEAPIIPVQSLEYSGTKRYVYVVDDKGKAKRTEVLLGARIGNQVVIEQGVSIGDKIVVQGIVNMRDGVTVSELGQNTVSDKSTQKGVL